jgi:GMP synthase (glutamine-hydrolysing)
MALNLYIGFAQPDEWGGWAGTYARHIERFEKASGGTPCLVLPYYHATAENIRQIAPSAVLMSGFARSFQQYAVSEFYPVVDWLMGTELPILALCGSHQLLGFAFNRNLRMVERLVDEPMRHLRPGEPITNPDYHPDFYMERGFYHLNVTAEGRKDPLLKGMAQSPIFCESHYCEIKHLPSDFVLLGSTPECRIQVMRHKTRTLYGTQFHPEDYNDRFQDGKRLLENFFELIRRER